MYLGNDYKTLLSGATKFIKAYLYKVRIIKIYNNICQPPADICHLKYPEK